jgi:glycosyltransferase involved in cell wall biosynthesis
MSKRLLFVGEFSGLATGYGNYAREVLSRLHKLGYEVAEYASYASDNDPRAKDIPWPVFGVEPQPGTPEAQLFEQFPHNQFGRLRFETALLKWRADVVLTIRDAWMDSYVAESPLRPFFRWVYMPTVDSAPQESAWLDLFASADATLAYTEFGAGVLRDQGGGMIKPLGIAPPCIDDAFYPVPDKRAHKDAFGLDPNGLIVGFLSRNQPRKLIPDLFEAFSLFLERAPADLSRRTSLYCHTSFPDVGWNLSDLLAEYGLLSKVLFTYVCHACEFVFPSYFSSAKQFCPRCGRDKAHLPGTRKGVSRDAQRGIYNVMDAMVQYASCEGFGMGQTEAAACGVPLFAVDYSAMAEVVRKVGGFPVRVGRMFRDHGTNAKRAMPDNEHLAELLSEYLSLPTEVRARKGFETRRLCEENFRWDGSVGAWKRAIEVVPPPELSWDCHPRPFPPADFSYQGPSDAEFLRRGITLGANRPDLLNSHLLARHGSRPELGNPAPGRVRGQPRDEPPRRGILPPRGRLRAGSPPTK